MSCTKCRRPGNEHLRAAWGCDAEVRDPVLTVDCVLCEGEDADCSWCNGTGEMPVTRCPHATIQPEHTMTVQALAFAQVGLMPSSAGWAEHPATLLQGIALVAKAKEHFEKEPKRGT